MAVQETQEVTTIEKAAPVQQVVKTTKQVMPPVEKESPQKVYEQKKTIFRFYQVIWYILAILEVLLGFRFVLKLFGANPLSGFASLIYDLSQPLILPFQGLFPSSASGVYLIEWSTLVAMVVYALVSYGLVEAFQLIKPVGKEEVEQNVDK